MGVSRSDRETFFGNLSHQAIPYARICKFTSKGSEYPRVLSVRFGARSNKSVPGLPAMCQTRQGSPIGARTSRMPGHIQNYRTRAGIGQALPFRKSPVPFV